MQQTRPSSRIRPGLSRIRKLDPRLYQITVLGLLLIYGIGWLDFEVGLRHALITLGSCLLVQYVLTHIFRLPAFDPRSALISGLSLCLLLRTNELWLSSRPGSGWQARRSGTLSDGSPWERTLPACPGVSDTPYAGCAQSQGNPEEFLSKGFSA